MWGINSIEPKCGMQNVYRLSDGHRQTHTHTRPHTNGIVTILNNELQRDNKYDIVKHPHNAICTQYIVHGKWTVSASKFFVINKCVAQWGSWNFGIYIRIMLIILFSYQNNHRQLKICQAKNNLKYNNIFFLVGQQEKTFNGHTKQLLHQSFETIDIMSPARNTPPPLQKETPTQKPGPCHRKG